MLSEKTLKTNKSKLIYSVFYQRCMADVIVKRVMCVVMQSSFDKVQQLNYSSA